MGILVIIFLAYVLIGMSVSYFQDRKTTDEAVRKENETVLYLVIVVALLLIAVIIAMVL
jgi:Na+/H+ antiporter NhaC